MFSFAMEVSMARLGRYFIDGQALHLIQRGNNRQAIFHSDDDYRVYRSWLVRLGVGVKSFFGVSWRLNLS